MTQQPLIDSWEKFFNFSLNFAILISLFFGLIYAIAFVTRKGWDAGKKHTQL